MTASKKREMDSLTAPLASLRAAAPSDIPALCRLIDLSVRGLSQPWYSPAQIESALRFVFGPDRQLITDATYYVAEWDGVLVAAGGWSRRRTLYGGDQMKGDDDQLLDAATEPARIRAFFVHPDWARRGLARRLFARCNAAARAAGFRMLELVATGPGEPLYAALGFTVCERFSVILPDGIELPLARMARAVDPTAIGLR